MADTKKPNLTVREFALWQLERIAAEALAKAPKCVAGRRVDIERLMQEGFDIQLVAFHELTRRWKTYAFIDTTAKKVFVDADLMDNPAQAKKYRFTLGEELAHKLIHTSLFANCRTIEDRLAIEDGLGEVRKARLENNARALASAMLMPEATVRISSPALSPSTPINRGASAWTKWPAPSVTNTTSISGRPSAASSSSATTAATAGIWTEPDTRRSFGEATQASRKSASAHKQPPAGAAAAPVSHPAMKSRMLFRLKRRQPRNWPGSRNEALRIRFLPASS